MIIVIVIIVIIFTIVLSTACYAFHNQECAPVDTGCREVPGLCMAGGKCCNTG